MFFFSPPALQDSGSDIASDGSESDGEVDIENEFEKALQYVEDDPEESLQLFQKVLELEDPPGEWGFKAVQQTINLCLRIGNLDKMLTSFQTFLNYGKVNKTQTNKTGLDLSLLFLINVYTHTHTHTCTYMCMFGGLGM